MAVGSPGQWDIPELAVKAVPGSTDDLGGPIATDGKRLYATRRDGDQVATHLLRLDPSTGATLAEHRYEPPPPASNYDAAGVWIITGSEVVVLEGARSHALVLDADTLRMRARIPLPPNSRSTVPFSGRIDPPIWIGHRSAEADRLAGVETFMGATRLDLAKGVVGETRATPPCGTVGGAQPNATLLVVDVDCAEQIAFIDLKTGKSDVISAFQRQTDIAGLDSNVWARWRLLGFIGKIDVDVHTFRALDLNAEGPILATMGAISSGGGSIWVAGDPADSELQQVVYRIDPESVEITARAWNNTGVAVLGDVGYTITADRRLASFDPASVNTGRPRKVTRPNTTVIVPYRPRDADERAVIDTFLQVYDYRRSQKDVAPLLEDAAVVAPVRAKLVELVRTFADDLEVVVTQVTVVDDRASVVYSFLVNGKPAFGTVAGSLVRDAGRWKVTKDSLCRLAVEAAVTPRC